MFTADSRFQILEGNIIIRIKEELEGYGCEKKTDAAALSANSVKLIEIFTQITGKKPSNKILKN